MSGRFAVIGAGAIGLTCAYFLRREGVNVLVVDRDKVGSGASSGNAGWIVPSLAVPLPSPSRIPFAIKSVLDPHSPFHIDIRAARGMAGWLFRFAQHCNSSDYKRGLNHLASLAEPTMGLFDELHADGIQFEMKSSGLLFVFLSRIAAEREIALLTPMRTYGYDIDDSPLTHDALHELSPALSNAVRFGVLVAGERHINPSSLLVGLTKRLRERGVDIHEGVEISGFVRKGTRVQGLITGTDSFDVDGVLIAAGAWSAWLGRKLGADLPIEAGKGYSFSLELEPPIPTLPLYLGEAMIGCTPMDAGVRLAGTMELSRVDRTFNQTRVESMKRSAVRYLRGGSWNTTSEHWMGIRPLTPDGLPILGRLEPFDNVYVATGHQALGITLAPATGAAMAQLIARSTSAASLTPFSADRFA